MVSKFEPDQTGFKPMYQKAGWNRNEMARRKALKRENWFKGGKEKEVWKKLTRTTNMKIMKKKKLLLPKWNLCFFWIAPNFEGPPKPKQ